MHREKLGIIFAKTKGRCWYCGRSVRPFDDWQVEHQIPRCLGGGDEIENLVPSCRECNAAKGKRTVEEYRHSLLVKLEHAITEAYETAEMIEGRVGWDRDPDENGLVVPPGWLSKIAYLLHEAATDTVNAKPLFYGERAELEVERPQQCDPIQQSETVA